MDDNKTTQLLRLKETAEKVIERTPMEFQPKLIVVSKGKWPASGKRKLMGYGPEGDVAQDASSGRIAVIFSAYEVLEFVKKELEAT